MTDPDRRPENPEERSALLAIAEIGLALIVIAGLLGGAYMIATGLATVMQGWFMTFMIPSF